MEPLKLDLNGIHEYQQNRYPYLLIDRVEALVPGESAKGFKNLTANDWFFETHFPGDANMPGMLQLEAMVQIAALMLLSLPGNKGKVAYLSTANNIKLSRKVVPGDRLDFETRVLSLKRGIAQCAGEGKVGPEVACKAEFSLVLPHIMSEFKVSPQGSDLVK